MKPPPGCHADVCLKLCLGWQICHCLLASFLQFKVTIQASPSMILAVNKILEVQHQFQTTAEMKLNICFAICEALLIIKAVHVRRY